MTEIPTDFARFLRGEIDPAAFPHREHVRMAFEMLLRHDFLEAALHYSRALRAVTAGADHPEKFHLTVTIAFLSLVAERMHGRKLYDFAAFAAANPDLLDKSVLGGLYRPGRLSSEAARTTFLLPEPLAALAGTGLS